MSTACDQFGISRQAVYQWKQRLDHRLAVLSPIENMVLHWRKFMPRVGTRKLYYLIKPQLIEQNIKIGRDGLFRYLRFKNLRVKPKKSYTKTTNSKHWLRKHPNLLQGKQAKEVESIFVSDITYVQTDQGTHYLSLVTDACSRKIMGYELSDEMKASDVVKALKMAISQRTTQNQAIHHSDRGLQYCSAEYQTVLSENKIKPSMTDGYDCYQNALAERINGILKQEFLLYKCKTIDELKRLVEESIEIYNEMRPHLSLDMKTPNQVHRKASCMTQLA